MNSPLYMQEKHQTSHELKFHNLLGKSFIFVPTAGMRLAPEVLVLEIMREVFYKPHHGPSNKGLAPGENNNPEQNAVLHALRGRRKQAKHSRDISFYAPAYPSLAESGWLGKRRERVIYNFLLRGALAQHLWGRGETNEGKRGQKKLSNAIHDALIGEKSCLDDDLKGKDILAATLGASTFKPTIHDDVSVVSIVKDKLDMPSSVMRISGDSNDPLAKRIHDDLIAICEIECELPRMQWILLLMTFLRFALPMWLLAQMQLTMLLHGWLLKAADLDENLVIDKKEIEKALLERNLGLLHPTLTPTRQVHEHIEKYMKCRVEINIFLYCMESINPTIFGDKTLSLGEGGSKELSIRGLLDLVKNMSGEIKNMGRFNDIARGQDIKTFLTREGEQFSAWRNPLKKGQGKNIDEFLRVLYKAQVGDEGGGYFLEAQGRGIDRAFRVFPGQFLLKTIAHLSARKGRKGNGDAGTGILVLQDIENTFSEYGIDFATFADARPRLMQKLREMGLLVGSPDAGSSVAINPPW